jgi:uncharacterized membrane protein
MSPEDGAKLLISGGLVSPEYKEELVAMKGPRTPVPMKSLT